jgi:hypothetical protein
VAVTKFKTAASVFELPQKLGVVQYVEYERRCADGGCLYEGVATAEGCRRGVCVKYRVRTHSRDRRNWAVERRTRMEWGGCLSQALADALWELSGRYDVGVWYEYRVANPPCMFACLLTKECYLVINGVRLSVPYCRSTTECVEQILEDYRRGVERLKEPPPAVGARNPAEQLLRKYPELEAFGAEWVRAWAPHAEERLAEIAEVMRRFPWMVEVVRKKAVSPHPHAVEAYVAADGSVVCLSLGQLRYCSQNGAVKAVKLELELSRHEIYEGRRRGVYRPKGLLTFSAVGKEYVKIL